MGDLHNKDPAELSLKCTSVILLKLLLLKFISSTWKPYIVPDKSTKDLMADQELVVVVTCAAWIWATT